MTNHSKSDPIAEEPPCQDFSVVQAWWTAVPVFVLLILELACQPLINSGFSFLTPMTIPVYMIIITVLCTDFNVDTACRNFLAGSMKVAEKLFSIGVFLACLNIIGQSGPGALMTECLKTIPENFRLILVMLTAFFFAIPVGAHCSAILLILLPPLALGAEFLQDKPLAFGWIAIATALGAHLSPVQVNVLGLASKFDISVSKVIRGNIPYIVTAMFVLLTIAYSSGLSF